MKRKVMALAANGHDLQLRQLHQKSGIAFLFSAGLGIAGVLGISPCNAASNFLDITTFEPGTFGSFSGTLGGVSVTGNISTANTNFHLNPVSNDNGGSTVDNSSAQFSFGNIFTPSIPSTDRVGYETIHYSSNPVTITVNFSSALANPVFEIANLDGMTISFGGSSSLQSLRLLGGNGADGDGIQVSGLVVSDADPSTGTVENPGSSPPTSGPRSAYGAVQLTGLISTFTMSLNNPPAFGDSGSFTLAFVQKPGDINDDDKVDVADLGILATSYSKSADAMHGDINNDGVVNVADLGILATNYGYGTTGPQLSLAAAEREVGLNAVPEPASLGLLALVWSLVRRNRA